MNALEKQEEKNKKPHLSLFYSSRSLQILEIKNRRIDIYDF